MQAANGPYLRFILGLDIENSTLRINADKAILRDTMYELALRSLRDCGIKPEYHDDFVDRGDGILILIHTVDQVPVTVLLGAVMPRLRQLLEAFGDRHPGQAFRMRAVLHLGLVHYDGRGRFGEELDVAFRLLDAPTAKRFLRESASPLVLVVSDEIHRWIIRQGYAGIDEQGFRSLGPVTVNAERTCSAWGWNCTRSRGIRRWVLRRRQDLKSAQG